MNTLTYQHHNKYPDEYWECLNCGIPHFTSSLFETSSSVDTNISLSSVSSCSSEKVQSPGNTQVHSPGKYHPINPIHSSTPTGKRAVSNTQTSPASHRQPKSVASRLHNLQHIKILTVNCQSVKKKNLGFINMLSSVKPDIVLGNESWLKPSIKNSEVFPSHYDVYRQDRKGRTGGGVFVLVSKKYTSCMIPDLKSSSELLWVNVKQNGKKIYLSAVHTDQIRIFLALTS
jgi:hypothetical protein